MQWRMLTGKQLMYDCSQCVHTGVCGVFVTYGTDVLSLVIGGRSTQMRTISCQVHVYTHFVCCMNVRSLVRADGFE
jgi:hypothetical protein